MRYAVFQTTATMKLSILHSHHAAPSQHTDAPILSCIVLESDLMLTGQKLTSSEFVVAQPKMLHILKRSQE